MYLCVCVCLCWQDEIVGSEREQYLVLFHLYLPVFMQLVNVLLIKVRMPADDVYSSWNDGRFTICVVSFVI